MATASPTAPQESTISGSNDRGMRSASSTRSDQSCAVSSSSPVTAAFV